jgi:putative membrane-bound dehydrogenase-like protein
MRGPTVLRRAPTLFVVIVALAVAGRDPFAAAAADPQWQLPPGFTIELVAGPPLVQHPTMGGFDDQGRLYICDGPGENMPAKELLEKLPNQIRRLEDTDGDGRFDRSTMYADKMTFPMGALWLDGDVYTASPPHIWKLRDTDGDGVADERKILVSEFGFTGNAADIHGCFLGPEGRIYWCDGRHGHNFTDADGKPISKGLAARLFSCNRDGTDVEAFAGGGMDNPVEVAFTETGEPLGTVAIYDNNPDRVDALIHWAYGGAYPYAKQVLGEFKRTGPLLPAVRYYGRVAPAGVARHRSNAWGDEYRDNLFHAQFNTHRVLRTKLTRDGATFRGEDEDFLVANNQDVHLTDVIEDADGSLLVVDTGGWFRIGCPNSQIAKPEILGGIYRIRKTDTPKVDDPRGLQVAWNDATPQQLVARLNDERPAVRDRAMATLTNLGSAAIEPLQSALSGQDESTRRNVAWTLARLGTTAARGALREATRDVAPSVRQAAVRGLGTLHDEPSFVRFVSLLDDSAPPVRREAAAALGRLRQPSAVPPLLAALRTSGNDRFLEHALIYALIQINDGSATIAGLGDAHPAVRRGALIALDQNDDSRLTRDAVAKLLDDGDAALQRAALEVMQRHADWADGILVFLQNRLAAATLTADEAELLRDTILAYKADARVQAIVAAGLSDASRTTPIRLLLLEVIERSELNAATLPNSWAEQLAAHLASEEEAVARRAVTAATRIGGANFDVHLVALASNASRPEPLRIAALAAVGPRLPALDAATFSMLHARLTTAKDSLDRLAAANVLGVAPLDAAQRDVVLHAIAEAGPLELPPLLQAFAKPTSADEGLRLVAALTASPGLDNVPSSTLEKLLAAYSDDVRRAAAPLFKRINADIEVQRARLAELSSELDAGNAQRGAIVFQMAKTGCSSCHRVGTRGTAIGPDLTKVGQIRARGDLLESVVFPSASFVRNYESVAVETSDGRIVVGLLSRETPEAVYIRTPQKEEVRVARSEVESITPSKLSIMPQGMDKVMTPTELRDLIAYLQTLK